MHSEPRTNQSDAPETAAHHSVSKTVGDAPDQPASDAAASNFPVPALTRTLPPAVFEELLAADGSAVLVFSTDRGLAEVVRAAGGTRYAVELVEQWPEVVEAVRGGRADIVLLDADAAGRRIEKRVVELEALGQPLVIAVAARRDAAAEHMDLVASARAHRLLIKPASVGTTRLLLESAANRYFRLRERHAMLAAAGPPRRSWLAGSTARQRVLAAAALGVIVLGAAGAAAVAWLRPGSQAAPQVAPQAAPQAIAAPPAAIPGRIGPEPIEQPPIEIVPLPLDVAPAAADADPFAAQLAAAAQASADGRIVEPAGDSAIDRYAAILEQDPAHAQASRELDALLTELFAEIEWALLEGAVDDAAAIAAHVRRVRRSSGRLIFLEAQIQQALAGAAEAAPAAQELASLLTIAGTRLEQGQLSTPRGDSALDYFRRAAELAPEDAQVQALSAALASAFAAAARVELEGGNVDRAGQLVALAAQLDLDGETRALLDLNIATVRQRVAQQRQSVLLASGIERLEAGALIEPDEDSALYYLSALRADDPQFSGLEVVWNRLLDTLEGNAARAIDAGDAEQAGAWIDGLESAGAEPVRVQALRDEIEFRRRQAEYLAAPALPGELQVISSGAFTYPPAAASREVEGWIELEYVVDTTGVPKDITIVGAEPQGWFEEAALESLAQYRFVPFTYEGQVYERRVRTRINYNVE